jgi:hypothetical protein
MPILLDRIEVDAARPVQSVLRPELVPIVPVEDRDVACVAEPELLGVDHDVGKIGIRLSPSVLKVAIHDGF